MTALAILSRTFRPLDVPTKTPHRACPNCRAACVGVYLLIDEDQIVYVGTSADIAYRLYAHGRDKTFDRVLWMAIPQKVYLHYEGALIRALRPKYNRGATPLTPGNDNEILDGLGLPEHADEVGNERAWLAYVYAQRLKRDAAARGERADDDDDDDEDDDTITTGELIREWRAHRGLTQAQLAGSCDVSDASVSYWETDATTPTTDRIEMIAAALGVSVSEFWAGPPTEVSQ